MKRPVVLALLGIPQPIVDRLSERYDVVDGRSAGVLALAPDVLRHVRGVVCTGRAKLGQAELATLPALEIVSSYSAGLDGIDEAALAVRLIPLRNTSHILAGAVADFAMTSALTLLRRLPDADRFVRAGHWQNGSFPLVRDVSGCRVGLLGFGHIGKAVARRAAAFDMVAGYCARAPKADRPEPFFASALALAEWADVLVVACSANESTRHLVGARVLRALGADGILVNVARGVIVDDKALAASLATRELGAAAIDVFSREPDVPDALLGLDNVLLTPHIGSATTGTRDAMARATVDALDDVLTPSAGVRARGAIRGNDAY